MLHYYNAVAALTAAAITIIFLLQEAQGQESDVRLQLQQLPNCTCKFGSIRNCSEKTEFESSAHPEYEHMFPSYRPECIPDIPINSRVCFMTTIKNCRYGNGLPFNGCRIREGRRDYGLRTAPLNLSGSENERIVTFNSVHPKTETNAVCFYNVNVSSPADTNNTGIMLQSASGNAGRRSVDDISSVVSEDNSTVSCKSYLKVFYTKELEGSEQQSYKVCVRDVMRPDFSLTIPDVTSLFIVYWTNNDSTNQGNSFNMQARPLQ